jgi:DNA-binding GntR family transcriptional regulator
MSTISDRNYSSDPLFNALRDRIISGIYLPGTLLIEKNLTKEFNVSRTPYREAIRKLTDMKLVTVVPRFGTYVREVSITEANDAYEVRMRLEMIAAELAAKRKTPEQLVEFEKMIHKIETWDIEKEPQLGSELDARFHELICKASQNALLVETVYNLRLICARIWTSSWRESYNFKKLVTQLTNIYEAVKGGDAEKASREMGEHIQNSIDLLKSNLFNLSAGKLF